MIKNSLLILGADEIEVNKIKGSCQSNSSIEVHTIGIGAVEAAATTSKLILEHFNNKLEASPVFVLFIGSVGSYQKSIPLLSLITASTVTQCIPSVLNAQCYQPEKIVSRHSANSKFLNCLSKTIGTDLNIGDVCCPPAITQDSSLGANISSCTKCLFENLELFGVAAASNMLCVPWACLSAVTNHVDSQSHEQWSKNRLAAADKTAKAVNCFIKNGLHSLPNGHN